MRLDEIPNDMRVARTSTLKGFGFYLKNKKLSKNLRRRLILQLDLDIIFRIMDKMDEISGFSPGYTQH